MYADRTEQPKQAHGPGFASVAALTAALLFSTSVGLDALWLGPLLGVALVLVPLAVHYLARIRRAADTVSQPRGESAPEHLSVIAR